MKTLAPVVLFTYNRPKHLLKTLEALRNNDLASQTEIYIYSDGSRNEESNNKVREVREILNRLSGFKNIHLTFRETNVGLAANIINGVTEIVNKFGKVIVLEDDLVTSPYFLKFMNQALDTYENKGRISQVVGYSYYEKNSKKYNLTDGVLVRGADCLGWGTWSRAWEKFNPNSSVLIEQLEKQNLVNEFNFDNSYNYFEMLKLQNKGQINSWAIRWMASAFLEEMYTYYPSKSLVIHIGNDSEASNYFFKSKDPLRVPVCQSEIIPKVLELNEDLIQRSRLAHIAYLKKFQPSLLEKIIRKVYGLLRKSVNITR
ncbi:glycosyltransferase [Leptospira sp. 96542]|nr:glycosyltransferase [Leptospira sp. 96542]